MRLVKAHRLSANIKAFANIMRCPASSLHVELRPWGRNNVKVGALDVTPCFQRYQTNPDIPMIIKKYI